MQAVLGEHTVRIRHIEKHTQMKLHARIRIFIFTVCVNKRRASVPRTPAILLARMASAVRVLLHSIAPLFFYIMSAFNFGVCVFAFYSRCV